MKKTYSKILSISLILFTLSCNQKKDERLNDALDVKKTSISGKSYLNFLKNEHDFGTITKDELVKFDFEFINESEKPIIVYKADVSCGCLSTNIPIKPILKGDKGTVSVTANTKMLDGYFDKKVYVTSNADNDVVLLHVKGFVNK